MHYEHIRPTLEHWQHVQGISSHEEVGNDEVRIEEILFKFLGGLARSL